MILIPQAFWPAEGERSSGPGSLQGVFRSTTAVSSRCAPGPPLAPRRSSVVPYEPRVPKEGSRMSKPHIVLIMADHLRRDCLSCYGRVASGSASEASRRGDIAVDTSNLDWLMLGVGECLSLQLRAVGARNLTVAVACRCRRAELGLDSPHNIVGSSQVFVMAPKSYALRTYTAPACRVRP